MNDIQQMIKSGESEKIEFKESFDKEIIETVGDFANTKFGVILIGISDKGKIKGIQIGKDTLKGWANQISQSTEPSIISEIWDEEIDKKYIGIINIPEYPIKPVSVKGRCYRRVGNSNRIMTPQEVAQMHLNSTGGSWDALLARDALLDDIDSEKVKRYIKKTSITGRRKIGEAEALEKVLEKLGLTKEGKPTWAAILLFGERPQATLLQAKVHCGRFKGETTIIDDRMIDGAVIEQVDEVMDFIHKNISVKFVMTGKPARDEIWDYPLEALREAVINAVCHRDYTLSSDIQIRIYDDKLVVWSPGGLPFGITMEDLYKPHSSVLRNKGIAGIFYDIGWIEQWGSGIDKMRKACLGAGIPEPLFEEYQGFRVTFRKDIFTEDYLYNLGLNGRQIKAVMYVKEKGKITNKVYQELNTVSNKTAYLELSEIVEKDVFVLEGSGRKVMYTLKVMKK